MNQKNRIKTYYGELRDVDVYHSAKGLAYHVVVVDIESGKTLSKKTFRGNYSCKRALEFAQELASREAFDACI